ncbi:MAG: hypothetical protein JJE04_21555 [Acidobacteriia bacterium]|nr:hypothetical protein [Terriglobia bacterium]
MYCCDVLADLAGRDIIHIAPLSSLTGRILTEIDTEYFFVFGDGRPSYVGINYCPFCGRALSRQLWNMEKKKQ